MNLGENIISEHVVSRFVSINIVHSGAESGLSSTTLHQRRWHSLFDTKGSGKGGSGSKG